VRSTSVKLAPLNQMMAVNDLTVIAMNGNQTGPLRNNTIMMIDLPDSCGLEGSAAGYARLWRLLNLAIVRQVLRLITTPNVYFDRVVVGLAGRRPNPFAGGPFE